MYPCFDVYRGLYLVICSSLLGRFCFYHFIIFLFLIWRLCVCAVCARARASRALDTENNRRVREGILDFSQAPYSKASADRTRRTGGSQSISKCAREIGRTVSQFLNVYGQVSQFLKTKCTEIGPDAYKVGRRVPIYIVARVCSAPTHVAGQAPLSGAPSHNRMWRPYLPNSPERDVLHALESTLRTHAHSQPAHSVT